MSTALFATYCAAVAVVFSVIRPGWFGPWFQFLLWLEGTGKAGQFIAKPLGMCEMCVAGQLGLWAHFYASGCSHSMWPQHILSACIATLISVPITYAYNRWKQ